MKYIDYGTMQSEAQRRVLEMQQKACGAVRYQMPSQSGYYTEPVSDNCDSEPEECRCHRSEPAACHAECNGENAAEGRSECDNGNLQSLLKQDPEQMLLLVILVLLLAEKADMILILALVYLVM